MMKKFKAILVSALMITGLFSLTACGMGNGSNNDSQAPYEDETNSADGVNNGPVDNHPNGIDNVGEDIQNGIDNIGEDIQNGIDNVGEDIQNGINNGVDDMQNDTINNGSNGTSSLEKAGKNLMNSIEEASAAIRDGIQKLTNHK